MPNGGSTRSVGRDEDLSESGLSSLDTVNLMLAVEAEFDVKIPDRDMTPANFRTIARIDALVGALLAKAQARRPRLRVSVLCGTLRS